MDPHRLQVHVGSPDSQNVRAVVVDPLLTGKMSFQDDTSVSLDGDPAFVLLANVSGLGEWVRVPKAAAGSGIQDRKLFSGFC